MHERVVALLKGLGGVEQSQALLERLWDGTEPIESIVDSIVASPRLERLYKRSRTLDIGIEGPKEADKASVGLKDMPSSLSFPEQFQLAFRSRLGKRAEGFSALFDLLLTPRRNLLILETGCMRIPGNWEGDGQSTFMFDALVRECGGLFFSIDAAAESVDTARRACSSATQLILNDSVAALYALSRIIPIPASLIYLDSFDFDQNDPLPSAIHHAMEVTAARSLIGSGTIVCVDDYALGPAGGKGMILDKFFSSIQAEAVYCGYQKAWRVP
jgi:hypothetical protein